MKRLFYKVFIFFLLILAAYVVIELMIRNIPNEYKFKKEYLDRNSENIEVLFIGASEIHCGLDPAYFRKKSFNLGHPGQSMDYCYEILKKYENKWSSLDYIVLPASYTSLFYKMEDSKEAWRVKNYRIYYKIKISKRIRSYAEVLNGQLIDHFPRLFNYYFKNVDEIRCTDKGCNISNTSETQDDLAISGLKAAKRHTIPKQQQCYEEMKSALDSIIGFSKRNNCKIIFCTSPAYKSYRENFDKYQFSTTINTFMKAVEENSNCTYLDLLDDKRFDDKDFLDADHLNSLGARKLSSIIDSIIGPEY
jgi:hypothetical protein